MAIRLNIHIEKTPDELAQSVAEKLVAILSRAIDERKSGSLVLSGGETPRGVYHNLGSKPLSERLDWNCVHLFFGDERSVPPDHPDSNYGMARRELIDQVLIPGGNVHRIHGELPPLDAAREYGTELQSVCGKGIPRFDCVLLGLGEDGHTASLFPGTEALNEREKSVVALFVPRLNTWRITMTFPVLNNARDVIFLAGGERKAPILKKMIESALPSPNLPATMVRPHDGELHWMLDTAAASFIRNPGH
jgi:6-phosphogluconolactonase